MSVGFVFFEWLRVPAGVTDAGGHPIIMGTSLFYGLRAFGRFKGYPWVIQLSLGARLAFMGCISIGLDETSQNKKRRDSESTGTVHHYHALKVVIACKTSLT